jgi:hypothetical protein
LCGAPPNSRVAASVTFAECRLHRADSTSMFSECPSGTRPLPGRPQARRSTNY